MLKTHSKIEKKTSDVFTDNIFFKIIFRLKTLLSLCMYLFKEYARTATTEDDNKRNVYECIFLKFFVLVITRYCFQLGIPCAET